MVAVGRILVVGAAEYGYTQRVALKAGVTTKEATMPKLKTHSGAAKRFKKTGTGKFKRGHSKMRHILTSKNNKTKSRLGKAGLISDADHYNVSRMLPYA
jgi:large subunit ribosomal protein L35